MVHLQTTRQLGIICLLLAIAAITCCNGYPRTENDRLAKWMAPLKQYGWSAEHLKNKVEHGDVTTFELGTPNYQILNPEDEPEYITADQPHYQQMLKELTSGQNGTDTIDMDMISKSSNYVPIEAPEKSLDKWEKLKKRSSEPKKENETPVPSVQAQPVDIDVPVEHPRIQVFKGARPFQSQIANLS
ncbi:uncharacterized protein [Drosophila tropicalis]|uniref:uncharacterized protein n=1 Tax=Drosophila tropicalis TaxID=46794 RepID=UPI0035ABB4D0